MNNDNNMVNNPNSVNGGNSSPIIPKNINSNGSQNQLFQNNTQNNANNSSVEDDINYTPAVNVPGLDELEDYVDEEGTTSNVVNNNLNTQNSNLNSNSFNSNTSVNSNQVNVGIDSNVQEPMQIDMAVVDDTFDENSKNFSPNIDMTNLVSSEDLVQDEVFNPTQELGVDANNFGNQNSQLQSKPADFGFDPFNKFDEATEENFLPGFDQNFYNPDYDDSTNFMPGIVPDDEDESANSQPIVEDTSFVPDEKFDELIDTVIPNPTPVPAEPVQSVQIPGVEPIDQIQQISNTVSENQNVGEINPQPQMQYGQVPNPNMGLVEPVVSEQPVQVPNVEMSQPAQPVQMPGVEMGEPVQSVQPIRPVQPVQPIQQPIQTAQPVRPVQPVQYTPAQEHIKGFVNPTQSTKYTHAQDPNKGFVEPMKPMNSVAPVSPVNPMNMVDDELSNNIPSNGVPQQPIMEPVQPIVENNPEPVNSDSLVDSIDSLDDFTTSMFTPDSANTVATISPKINYSMSNFNSLLTPDKRIVTFVGTSKNGTSFLVNNLAAIFSSLGINTAILDMTHNRNSYYIYTKCDENLRKVSYTSIEKLKVGESEGIKVNKNLTVYTALPNDGKTYDECEEILTTLAQNHSLVLIDCDFTTPMGYFSLCQEIYLVQSLDILTIQPLTAFLRDLKSNNVLEPEKVRVVINKEMKVGKLTSKIIISGMSSYNDPSMSFMTELFNKDTVNYCVIPFDERAYSKYLEGVVNCEISVNGFSSGFVNKLKTLAEMIYPLTSKQAFGKNNQNAVQAMQQQNAFSNSTNNTLNKMKNRM